MSALFVSSEFTLNITKPNVITRDIEATIIDVKPEPQCAKIYFRLLSTEPKVIQYGQCGQHSIISTCVNSNTLTIQNLKSNTSYYVKYEGQTYFFMTPTEQLVRKPDGVKNFRLLNDVDSTTAYWDRYSGSGVEFVLLYDNAVIGHVKDVDAEFCHFPFDVEPDRLQICAVNSQGERSDPADVTHVVDKPKPFYVHALFDYVAESMSPNLNRSTELSFRRGDTLKITGPIRECYSISKIEATTLL